jgi:hypothetical protein
MTDIHGSEYNGETVRFSKRQNNNTVSWLAPASQRENPELMIDVGKPEQWKYEILSVSGTRLKKGFLNLYPGKNILKIVPDALAEGIYIMVTIDITGEKHALLFRKN